MASTDSRPRGKPQSPAAQSPLLALPAELRNAIYENVITDISSFEIISGTHINAIEPGLLAVCHQIRDEALPMFPYCALSTPTYIDVEVHNFDFADPIAFITHAIKEHGVVVHGDNDVSIHMTMDKEWQQGKADLTDWLRFVGTTLVNMKGSAIKYHFECWLPRPDSTWYEGTMESAFPSRDHKSYKAHQASHIARHEYDGKLMASWYFASGLAR